MSDQTPATIQEHFPDSSIALAQVVHPGVGSAELNGVLSPDQRKQQVSRRMMQGEGEPTEKTRSPIEEDGESARRIAQRAGMTWRHFDTVLSPIIGHGGVAALYRRSLFLVCADHPWLPGAHDGALDPVEFEQLESAVGEQDAHDAEVAAEALVNNFRALLSDLIGPSLTERLLRPVPSHTSHGDAVQDTRP